MEQLQGEQWVPVTDGQITSASVGAVGVSEDQLRRAARSAVCKINIDSDGRLAMTAAIRKVLGEKPGEFDPRKYLAPARTRVKELVRHKVKNVLCCAGHAFD